MAAFANIAPGGPFAWESAIAYSFCAVILLVVFDLLGMWPFNRSPKLMQQPVLGIVLIVTCLVLGYVAFAIAVYLMSIEPLRLQLYIVSFAFGLFMIVLMFQMWPGRIIGPVAGGFVNILIAIVIGIIGYYGIEAFCQWHFGEAMQYPNDVNAMGSVLLGLCFPIWAAYSGFWDFWPLPPTPDAPPPTPDER